MSLNVGSVTIDPTTGTIVSTVGLAGRIFDGLNTRQDFASLQPGTALATARQQLADLAEVVAGAVVAEFVANAEVSVFVGPVDTGLQVSSAPGSPTAPNPALPASGLQLGIPGKVK